nr:uncharacterized protein LOC125630903 isoform X2 [Caretta caretta]XP_048693082.1 uncharacterized protein LOC125630903 isoform X3 [Caretta caretta]XP_048693083.1 uncharacterized protein LOC125630903 isoform X4 [Caretta caretta]
MRSGGSARGAVRGAPGLVQSRSAALGGDRSRPQPPALLAASGPVCRAAGRGFCARSHASAGINGRRRAAPLQASSPPLRLAEQRPPQAGERWIPRTALALPAVAPVAQPDAIIVPRAVSAKLQHPGTAAAVPKMAIFWSPVKILYERQN